MKRFQICVPYLMGFCILLVIEVFIALFVHDRFIRPYIGDVLVVALIYCLVRAVWRNAPRLLPLWVFLFAALVELSQLFHLAELLGAGEHTVLRVMLGSTFDVVDLLCYAVGGVLLFVWQEIEGRHNNV